MGTCEHSYQSSLYPVGRRGRNGARRRCESLEDPSRVVAFGDLDELNTFLGLAKEAADRTTASGGRLAALLEFLQQELFDLGAQLATPTGAEYPECGWCCGPCRATRADV